MASIMCLNPSFALLQRIKVAGNGQAKVLTTTEVKTLFLHGFLTPRARSVWQLTRQFAN